MGRTNKAEALLTAGRADDRERRLRVGQKQTSHVEAQRSAPAQALLLNVTGPGKDAAALSPQRPILATLRAPSCYLMSITRERSFDRRSKPA